MYNSIITWSAISRNKKIENNVGYLLDILPRLSFSYKTSSTYHIIDFMKPFHVELLTQYVDSIRVKDMFNSIIIDEKIRILIEFSKTSLTNISEDIEFLLLMKIYNGENILSFAEKLIQYEGKVPVDILKKIKFYLEFAEETVNHITSIPHHIVQRTVIDDIKGNLIKRLIEIILNLKDQIDILDNFKTDRIEYSKESVINIGSKFDIEVF